MLKNKIQILLTLVFAFYAIWWITFQHTVIKGKPGPNSFGNTYGIIALIGAFTGFASAIKWGGLKSILGKALFFFSFGLLFQEAGQLIYSYYIEVAKVQIPYPSWGDAAYFGSTLLYIIGAIYLTRVSGATLTLKNTGYKLVAIFIPIIILAVSYAILMHDFKYGHSSGLAIFLDNAYPIGEALYISIGILAFLLSLKLLGGVLKAGILFIIVALVAQYASDFTFVYQSNRGNYVPGDFDDLFYLIAYYIMGLALLKFYLIYRKLAKNNTEKNKSISNNLSPQESKT